MTSSGVNSWGSIAANHKCPQHFGPVVFLQHRAIAYWRMWIIGCCTSRTRVYPCRQSFFKNEHLKGTWGVNYGKPMSVHVVTLFQYCPTYVNINIVCFCFFSKECCKGDHILAHGHHHPYHLKQQQQQQEQQQHWQTTISFIYQTETHTVTRYDLLTNISPSISQR